MSDIAEVDAYILANLPASFTTLNGRKMAEGVDWYRLLDRRLQALRKRGIVAFTRNGRIVVWDLVK